MTSRYNFERVDYPMLQGIRFRRQVLTWGLGLVAWSLLLGSTLLAEEHDNRLHWARTVLITSAATTAILGRLGLEDSVKVGRAMLDHEDVADAARQQLLWQEGTDAVEVRAIEETESVQLVDGWEYFGQVALNWRSHLALLSPTDTGKSSFLYLLLGSMSRAREICLQPIEGKGAAWVGVPDANVVRINFRPSVDDAHRLCYRLHKTLDIIQQRVDSGDWEGPQLVTVIEEYLALSSTLKKKGGIFKPYGLSLEISVEAYASVARGGGGQMVLISQSPNAEDLKFSGGVRSNFRIACLGNRFGGFDAVERMLGNHNFVTSRDRDRIEAEYQAAKKSLFTERHPLVLTNLLGQWVCFPMPYLTEAQLALLDIKSLPVPPDLLVDDGWLPGTDEIGTSDYPSQPETINKPKPATTTINLDEEPQLNLEAIEGIILEVLAGASEPLKAHEIKRKRRPLKNVDKDLFSKVLIGMARRGDIHETEEQPPRYSLPPV